MQNLPVFPPVAGLGAGYPGLFKACPGPGSFQWSGVFPTTPESPTGIQVFAWLTAIQSSAGAFLGGVSVTAVPAITDHTSRAQLRPASLQFTGWFLVADSTIGPNPPNPVPFVLPPGSQFIAFTQVNSPGAVIIASWPKPASPGLAYSPSMAQAG
jgi:hypothetical protein